MHRVNWKKAKVSKGPPHDHPTLLECVLVGGAKK